MRLWADRRTVMVAARVTPAGLRGRLGPRTPGLPDWRTPTAPEPGPSDHAPVLAFFRARDTGVPGGGDPCDAGGAGRSSRSRPELTTAWFPPFHAKRATLDGGPSRHGKRATLQNTTSGHYPCPTTSSGRGRSRHSAPDGVHGVAGSNLAVPIQALFSQRQRRPGGCVRRKEAH